MLERRAMLIGSAAVAVALALLFLYCISQPSWTLEPSAEALAPISSSVPSGLEEDRRDTSRASEAPLGDQVDRGVVHPASGRIDFVPVPGEMLDPGDAWTLLSQPGGEGRALTGSGVAESILMAPGTYELQTVAGPRYCWPAKFRVERGRSTTIWVGSSHTLRVLIVDEFGAPIEGAAAEWIHLDARSRQIDDRPEARAATGPNGQVILEVVGPVTRGRLRCSRADFSPQELLFVTAPTVTLRVVLRRSPVAQWTGHIDDCELGTPLAGIEVCNGDRFLLGTSDADGVVHIPVDAGRRGALELRGPGIATSWVEAPLESNFHLCAVPTVRQEIRIGSGAQPVQLDLVVFGRDQGDGVATISEHRSEVVQGPSTILDLPRGARVLALAVDAVGARGQTELLVQDPTTPCALAWSESDDQLVLVVDGGPISPVVVEPVYETHIDLPPRMEAGRVFRLPFASSLRRIHIRSPGAVPLALVRAPASQGPRSGRVTVCPRPASRCDFVVIDQQSLPIAGVRVHVLPDRGSDSLAGSGPTGAQLTDHAGWLVQDDSRAEFVTNQLGVAVLDPIPSGPHWVSLGTPAEFRDALGSDLYQQQFRGLDVIEGRSSVTWTVPRPVPLLVEAVEAGTSLPVYGVEARLEGGLPNSIGQFSGNYWQGWVPASATRLLLRATGYARVELELPPPGERGSNWFARAEFVPGRDGRITLVGVPAGQLRGRTARLLAQKFVGDVWVMLWNGPVTIDANGGIDLNLPLDEASLTLHDGQSPPEFKFEPARQHWTRGSVVEFSVRSQ